MPVLGRGLFHLGCNEGLHQEIPTEMSPALKCRRSTKIAGDEERRVRESTSPRTQKGELTGLVLSRKEA